MNLLSRLRLGPRLAGAFAIVVALLIGSVAFAITRLQAQNVAMDHVVSAEVGSLLALMQLETQTQAASVSLRDSILSDKAAVVKAALAAVDKTIADIGESTQRAQALASADLAPQVEKVKAKQAVFVAALQTVAATMRSGDNDSAREQLVAETTRTARSNYVDALHEAVAAQRAETDAAGEAGAAAYATSRNVMLALAAAATLIAAAIGLAITRSVVGPARQAIDSARRIAAGDLMQDLHPQGRDEMAHLIEAMQAMQSGLRNTVRDIRSGASGVSTASAEIAQGNLDLSTRTEQQSSSLQQTASSMEQMSGTLRQSADASSQANQLAASALEVAERGGTVVAQVVTTMDEINDSSRKISDIIGTIDGIAFQTNILALNAAVEAARAGEQGRGFAVVASEVRSLAQRSAAAAREIKLLIGNSVQRVESGTQLVRSAGVTMGDIVSSVRRVTDIIAEITAATREQSAGIGSVNAAVTQLDHMTQQNAALVEESAAAAASLKDQSNRLLAMVDTFRLSSDELVRAN